MRQPRTADVVRVFLASPGDVAEERAFVRHYLETEIHKSSFLTRRVTFDVVSWDDPADGVPLPADRTPQEAVIRFKNEPSTCDFAIVILRDRMGTPLALESMKRPDGSRYMSGTEWEYENAFNAVPRPVILVYRGQNVTNLDPRDPKIHEKIEQFQCVETFFERFSHPDGSAKGGYKSFDGIDDFRTKLKQDMETVLAEWLCERTSDPAEPPRPTASIPRPANFLGRDADRETLVAAVLSAAAPNAILVAGPGGIGKTALTQVVAGDARVAGRFGPGRWFVELDTARDRDGFDGALLRALGLDPTQGFAAARACLAEAPCLLILDNLETPWDGDLLPVESRLADLSAIPGLVLLASFRGDEAIGGAPWSTTHEVRSLDEATSKSLFRAIARRIPEDDPHWPKFLDALGGMPLAIDLVARRAVRDTALAERWAQWTAIGPAMATRHGEDHRLTSIPRSIAFSLQSSRLHPPGLRLFRVLGQLPAGLADPDRQALLDAEATDAADQLQSVGLALRTGGRLDLLPPVRRYARDAYKPEGADTEWFRHYLFLTADLGPKVGAEGGAEALTRLVPDLPNIEAAIRAAIAADTLRTRCGRRSRPSPASACRTRSVSQDSGPPALCPIWSPPAPDPATPRARPCACSVWATSRCPARTTTRPARATRKRCRCIAAWAPCSARPTASSAWAISRWSARTTTRPARATRKRCRCIAAWAPCPATIKMGMRDNQDGNLVAVLSS